jgi:hypothetical protein
LVGWCGMCSWLRVLGSRKWHLPNLSFATERDLMQWITSTVDSRI